MSVALVTGGASGFGAEVARQLLRRGDSVVLCDVDEAGGQAVADEIGATFLRCDVSDFDQVVATTGAAVLNADDLSMRPWLPRKCHEQGAIRCEGEATGVPQSGRHDGGAFIGSRRRRFIM